MANEKIIDTTGLKYYHDNIASNTFVDKTSAQTINGAKTFTSPVYLTNSNFHIEKNSSSNVIDFTVNGTKVLTLGASSSAVNSILRANADNSKDLGSSTVRWKDVYLSGNLSDGTNSVSVANIAKTNADNSFSTAQTFKDITLYSASGDSPRLTFQRGTLTDTYNDWSIYDSSGYLYIQQRGNGSSAWETRATFTQSEVNFAGTLKQGGVAVATTNDLSSYVPTTRTVNGKALSSNITLTASDVGAYPETGGTVSLNGRVTVVQPASPEIVNNNLLKGSFVASNNGGTEGTVIFGNQIMIGNFDTTNPNRTTYGRSTISKASGYTLTLPDKTGTLAVTSDFSVVTTSGSQSVTANGNTLTFGSNAFNSTAIPTSYIASASVSGDTLTLTPNSGSAITFTASSGGGSSQIGNFAVTQQGSAGTGSKTYSNAQNCLAGFTFMLVPIYGGLATFPTSSKIGATSSSNTTFYGPAFIGFPTILRQSAQFTTITASLLYRTSATSGWTTTNVTFNCTSYYQSRYYYLETITIYTEGCNLLRVGASGLLWSSSNANME